MKFTEKLKTNAKSKKQFIAITSVSLAAVICAVGIPVGVHYSKQAKPAIDTQEGSASVLTTTDNGTNIDGEFLSEEEIPTANEELTTLAAAEDVTEPNTESAKDDPAKPVSNSSSSAKKPNTTKKETTTKKVTTTKAPVPEKTTATPKPQHTKADYDALIPRWKAYVESIGCTWDNSFSIEAQNASWQTGLPITRDKDPEEIYRRVCNQIDYKHTGPAKATRFKVIIIDESGGIDWSTCVLYI